MTTPVTTMSYHLNMVTLEERRIPTVLVTVYKCLHGAASSNIRSYLQVRHPGSYFLRGYAKFKPPAVRTTTFGVHSFRHLASNVWNKLPDNIRMADTLFMFKRKVRQFINKYKIIALFLDNNYLAFYYAVRYSSFA